MHPILKDRRFLSLYLLVWLVLAAMLAALLAFPGKISATGAFVFLLPLMLVYAFMSLSAWYVCRAFPINTTTTARLLFSNVLAAFCSSAVWVLAGYGWAIALDGMEPGLAPLVWHRESVPLLAAVGVILFLLAAAVSYLMETIDGSRAAERNALELQVLARDAELKALRAQIDPHFLFNSLNSISALTTTDPRSARIMTVKLAEFLRLSMNYGGLDTISLEQEMSIISRFLEIEKVRFGTRLMIETELDEMSKQCRVAPLLLQPLVENAVGHGIACLVDGGTIRLKGTKSGDRLCITIENPADPSRKKNTGTGIGIQNVRQRLKGLYGSEGRIDFVDAPTQFTATLNLPALV